MKKILLGSLALLMSTSLFAGTFDDTLKDSISKTNQALPIEIDKGIFWTKAEVKEKSVIYTFQMKNRTKQDFTLQAKDAIVSQMCTNSTTQALLVKGYTNESIYLDKDSKEITKIVINKKACGYDN